MKPEATATADRLQGLLTAPNRLDPFKKSVIADEELTQEQHGELVDMTGRAGGPIMRVVAAV